MKMLNWENLKSMLCPYCEKPLTKDLEVRCTECRFHIEIDRFKSIVIHRAFPNRSGEVKIKWQNLHDGRCPVDGHELVNAEGKFNVLRCQNVPECTFRIREDSLALMLKDPEHPANRFHKANDERSD